MRTMVTMLVLALIVMLATPFMMVGFFWAVAALLILSGLFFAGSVYTKVISNPPYKGVMTFLNQRQKVVLDEGWNFLPLWVLGLFGAVLVKMTKINFDMDLQEEVRTPDNASITFQASITLQPGIKDADGNVIPESLITYLDSGGEAGVRQIIEGVVDDRAKTWVTSNREGPSNWKEAQQLRPDAHEALVKAVLGEALEPIGNPIPTNTWMRFFDEPQSAPTIYDATQRADQEEPWAYRSEDGSVWNWDGLWAIFNGYDPEYQEELRARIEQRRTQVNQIREGSAKFGVPSLGITVHRLTIKTLKPVGQVAEAAERAEAERRQREAEEIEITTVTRLTKILTDANPNLPVEAAIRTVQTERGKVRKTVIEVMGARTDLGQDALAALVVNKLTGLEPQAPAATVGAAAKPKRRGKMGLRELADAIRGKSEEEAARILQENAEEEEQDEEERR